MALHFKALQVNYTEAVWKDAKSCVHSTSGTPAGTYFPVLTPNMIRLEIVR